MMKKLLLLIPLMMACNGPKTDMTLRPSLLRLKPSERDQLRALAYLYSDAVQILVRNDREIHSLKDLEEKTVYVGQHESGTRVVAQMILASVGLKLKADGEDEEDKEYYKDAVLDAPCPRDRRAR